MDTHKCCLLVHHHHVAHVDKDGAIWLSSVMGRWIEALADHFGEVRLLLDQSEQKLPQQDTAIVRKNVKLISLGIRKTGWRRIFQPRQMRRICAEAGQGADILLIRGVTPHQFQVWKFTPVAHKAFLLVGSLQHGVRQFSYFYLVVFAFFRRHYHFRNIAWMSRNKTLMLANSPVLVSEIQEMLKKQAHFVPTNSIRQSEFVHLQIRPISTPWRLLYCGRLDFNKGLQELLQALHILHRQGQPCHLDIVGEKTGPVYSELLKLSNMLEIDDLVDWHGFVPYGPALFEFYRKADAFILPSYSEGFPHAIWEAAANCCPVITTSVGGIPALLTHERHALLIPLKDVNAVVTAVERLLSDTALRESIITQAYSNARAFSVEACAQKLAGTFAQEWK